MAHGKPSITKAVLAYSLWMLHWLQDAYVCGDGDLYCRHRL